MRTRLLHNCRLAPALFLLLLAPGCRAQAPALPPDDSALLLGNPSEAGEEADNLLLERPQHSMSYNAGAGSPNWVAWHLQDTDLGRTDRAKFRPDPLLPIDQQIRPTDYRASGYDRGHVCPSGDRTDSEENNAATFVMSNMLPQTTALNQHLWKGLEDYSRTLVGQGFELYTLAGGVGTAGRIARDRVNVPAQCWKVILALTKGDRDLERITPQTRIIAVLMPNEETNEIAQGSWSQFVVSSTQIEQATGLHLLTNLPADLRQVLLAKVDEGAQ